MSEFYFEYQCIALKGVNKDKHALQFFLYQEYDKTSQMKVQVYIPETLQKQFKEVRLYNFPYGVGFPDLKKLSGPKVFPMKGGDHPISVDNGFFIEGENLNSTGIIAFVKEGEKEPLEENCYKYAINYSKRDVISYQIMESSNNFTVEIRYPRLLQDIELNVIYKSGSKPLFIEDREDENNILKNDKGKPYVIKLNKLGKEFTWKSRKFKFKQTRSFDFRLAFVDKDLNKFYMLLDESDYTMEDKDRRLKTIKGKKKSFVKERVIKCPYCNRPIHPSVIAASSGYFGCQGARFSSMPKYDGRNKYISCEADLIKQCEEENEKGAIVANNLLLPVGADVLPTLNIAVAGFPECGKTVYLASLINMSKTMNGSTPNYSSNPFILNQITMKMAKKDVAVTYVEMKNVKTVKTGQFEVDDRQEVERSRRINGVGIKDRYAFNVGQTIEKQTQKQYAGVLSYNPIGYKMGDLGFLYFYDVPGEAFLPDYTKKLRTFDMADGIIAIINGNTIYNGDDKNHANNDRPLLALSESLKAIKKLSNKGVDLKNMPIAIVFSKLDLKISNYLNTEEEQLIKSCFDENCHNLREDMLSLFPKNKKYRGSDLERHIDCSSYEIEHYLKSLSTDDASIYEKIVNEYHNIKFFACSALGSNDVFDTTGDGAQVKYRPRRLRVELPIVWLMHKKGLIK